MNRSAGILLPISSLPSKYGIGSFSKSAYDFVDWLVKVGNYKRARGYSQLVEDKPKDPSMDKIKD